MQIMHHIFNTKSNDIFNNVKKIKEYYTKNNLVNNFFYSKRNKKMNESIKTVSQKYNKFDQ